METLGLGTLKPESLTWELAYRLFTLRCRSKNVSALTLRTYSSHLELFKAWADTQALSRPAETSPVNLRAYLESLKARQLKDSTIDCAFRVLRTFWRFLLRDGLVIQDPMAKVERPRMERRLIRPFTPEELRALLGAIPTRTALGLRDFALAVLLADTGLRIAEALSLTTDGLDFTTNTVRVMGKGRKERVVPFGQSAKRALLEWLRIRGEIPGCSALWVNKWGQRISDRQFSRRLADYGKDAKLSGVRVSPHTLRHTFALQFLRGGGSPLALQAILGHSDLSMTRRYVQLSGDDLSAQHRQASPLDKLGVLPGERRRALLK